MNGNYEVYRNSIVHIYASPLTPMMLWDKLEWSFSIHSNDDEDNCRSMTLEQSDEHCPDRKLEQLPFLTFSFD